MTVVAGLLSREFFALAFNFLSSVFIIIINKMVFSVVNFGWPAALTLLHYVVTLTLLTALRCSGCFPAGSGPMTRRLWILSFLMGISPIVNNMSVCACVCALRVLPGPSLIIVSSTTHSV